MTRAAEPPSLSSASDFVRFVLPAKDHWVCIDLCEVEVDAINQLLFAGDTDSAKHAARHFAEQGFHDVQPRAVRGREGELEALGVKVQPGFGLLRSVGGVVVEQETDPDVRWIGGVEFAQQDNE